MFNEIVKSVAKKANISESAASIAVDTVIKALKDLLPQAVGLSLDSLIGSGTATNITKTVVKSVSSAPKPAAKSVFPAPKPAAKPAAKPAKPAAKKSKKDDPLGGLGDIVGAIGSLLGKK